MIECLCLDVDEPGPAVCATSTRTARKEHHCCECGELIGKGQRYENVRGLWDGHWSEFKTCAPCAAIRRDFLSCGWTYGMLWQDLWDAFGGDDDAEDWLG